MLIYDNIVGNEATELQNVRLHNVGSLTAPGNTANTGIIRYRTTDGTVHFWNGSAYKQLLSGPLTGADLTLANGQFFVGNGSNVATATAKTAIPLSGFGAAGADVSMGGFKLTNIATPVASTDAATKGYVDGIAQSLNQKQSVRSAGTVPLAVAVSGGNQILTSTVNADLNTSGGIGGVTNLAIGDRVLLNDIGAELTNFDLGIYVVTQVGSASLPHILTRADDANSIAELRSAYTFVEGGTSANSGWVQITEGGTLGTASFSWVQFSNAGTFTAGNGITLNGNAFNFFANSYTAGDLWYANSTSTLTRIPIGASNRFMVSSGTAPQWSGYAMPGSVATSQILYASSGSQISALATANSGVLVTSGSGVPSISTSLPSGVTYAGATIYRSGGPDIPLIDGGTGASLTAVNGGLVYSTASAFAITSAGTSGQFVRSGGAGAPTFFDLFGGNLTWTGTNTHSGISYFQNSVDIEPNDTAVASNSTSAPSPALQLTTKNRTSGGTQRNADFTFVVNGTHNTVLASNLTLTHFNSATSTSRPILIYQDDGTIAGTANSLTLKARDIVFGSNTQGTLTWVPTGLRTLTLPDATGTLLVDTTAPALGAVGVARIFKQQYTGDNTNAYIAVAHNLGSRNVIVQVRNANGVADTGSQSVIYNDIQIVDANTVRIYFNGIQPTSAYYNVTVTG